MSILDSLEKVSGESAGKVGRESLDRFSDKYLFSLEYRLVEPDIMEDVSSRLFNLFSTCVNIDEFFTAKFNSVVNKNQSGVNTSIFCVTVFFNYSWTSDADALKFFSTVISTTGFLSQRAGREGMLRQGVISVTLCRKDINGEVILNEPMTQPSYQGIFALYDTECMKRVNHMLYLLRGRESPDSLRTEREIKRIGWMNKNRYELNNTYRAKHGYHYEYRFDDTAYVLKEKTSGWHDYSSNSLYKLTVSTRRVDLHGRSLRELALRILLMNAFIKETTYEDNPLFTKSTAIMLHTPADALTFCLYGAYHKERRWNMTGNLDEMGVMNEYVRDLYASHVLEMNYDNDRMYESIFSFVNSVKIEDINAFIKKRSAINEHYKNINIL